MHKDERNGVAGIKDSITLKIPVNDHDSPAFISSNLDKTV